MNKPGTYRYVAVIFFIILLVLNIFTPAALSKKSTWWNKSYSYRQDIIIPIDTSVKQAIFQPIDTYIEFEKPCYAKDELNHSIRVICEYKKDFYELESQIYELDYHEKNIIKSCNLVFLIPEFADGSENYKIYYDEKVKNNPNYDNHVNVKESSYRYEFISGYPLKANFFDVKDDGYSIYQISYDGSFYGAGRTHTVGKLLDGSTEVNLHNGDIMGTFEFSYYSKEAEGTGDETSTCDKFISKEVLVDGNLMVELGIKSSTKNGEVTTTNFYKYYHNPTKDKRLHVKVKHEANKEIETIQKKDVITDGEILSLETGFTKSTAIKELNFGKMLPYLHFHNENDFISEYKVNQNPENIKGICKIDTNDDMDLGNGLWASFDEGKEGKAHAYILGSNNIIKSGFDERDGVQIKYYEMDNPHLKGLEFNHAGFLFTRNTYETGYKRDYIIPEDFCVEFYVDFFSTENGGYNIIPKESEIFKELVKIKPSNTKTLSINKKETGKNTLTVFLHSIKNSQLGFGLSSITGKNMSYETIELYKDGLMVSTGIPSKFGLKEKDNKYKDTAIGKLKSFITIIDLENISLFKKVIFNNLENGRYIIKVFRNNCKGSVDKKLIGYKIIELKSDKKERIYCRPSGLISVYVSDQNNIPLENVDCRLLEEKNTIINSLTSKEGTNILSAPIFLKKTYVLSLVYNGFSIYEKPIKLGIKNIIKPEEKKININRYDLKINIKDSWGCKFKYNINPILSSNQSTKKFSNNEKIDNSYIFKNIYSYDYKLQISYNNDMISRYIALDSDKNIEIILKSEYKINAKIFNNRGEKLDKYNIKLSRKGRTIDLNSNDDFIFVPPGNYDIEIFSDNSLIAKTKAEINSDYTITTLTNKEPIYPYLVIILSIIIFGFGSLLFFKKKRYKDIFILLSISLVLISTVLPWWNITGISEKENIQIKSDMYIVPKNLVSFTSNDDVFVGEISCLPDTFNMAIQTTVIFNIIAFIMLTLYLIFKNKRKISSYLLILALISIVLSLAIFTYVMSEYSKISVGNFIGNGIIEISLPGQDNFVEVLSNWGQGIGYNIMLLSLLVNLIYIIILYKNRFKKKILFFKKN